MKIIFAQGNPGSKYTYTRHNVGFLCLDAFAKQFDAEFVFKTKFTSEITEVTINGEKVLLVKPTSYYNETGVVARQLVDFYKLSPEADFLVIHDDLALPFGTIRTRAKGSDAGNNGIKSLNSHLGPNYSRIRIGIYTESRDQIPDVDFVLGTFTTEEKALLPKIYQQTTRFVEDFIKDSLENTKVTVNQT